MTDGIGVLLCIYYSSFCNIYYDTTNCNFLKNKSIIFHSLNFQVLECMRSKTVVEFQLAVRKNQKEQDQLDELVNSRKREPVDDMGSKESVRSVDKLFSKYNTLYLWYNIGRYTWETLCKSGPRGTSKRMRNTRGTFFVLVTVTAHNWQKWKRVFPTCLCQEIYRDEAVGLKSCKYTFKKYD